MSSEARINELLNNYSFPLAALEDVNHRLECCRDEAYVKQQVRYLENLISYGIAKRRMKDE
ncbi:DUF6877 family protein [Macrococcus bovicus]|uniref:DUF6877 family protein n=1 Tax=Macrococcus bovicus TaxID=69968 RepID=UPI0025A560D7|nr:DUF6877 family protein [Macrococcus bovicus]WJP97093.1 hypothetical protein QSV55_07350 [Macrococcus bovicus]